MVIRKVNTLLKIFGINFSRLYRTIVGTPKFITDVIKFDFLKSKRLGFPLKYWRPIFGEHLMSSGEAKGHYFYMDHIVSGWIHDTAAASHLDVGSRIDGFVSSICVFKNVKYIDIRPNNIQLNNFELIVGDIMETDFVKKLGKYESVSCLHTLEHFGLGRYGDRLDPNGYEIGLCNIVSLVKKGGLLYLAVPMGNQRLEYNAHRIFYSDTIPNILTGFKLVDFAYVDDAGYPNYPNISEIKKQNYFNQRHGCAIYKFKRD